MMVSHIFLVSGYAEESDGIGTEVYNYDFTYNYYDWRTPVSQNSMATTRNHYISFGLADYTTTSEWEAVIFSTIDQVLELVTSYPLPLDLQNLGNSDYPRSADRYGFDLVLNLYSSYFINQGIEYYVTLVVEDYVKPYLVGIFS